MTRSHAQMLTDVLNTVTGSEDSPAKLARQVFKHLTDAGYDAHDTEHLFYNGNRQLIFHTWKGIRDGIPDLRYPS